MDTKVNYTVVGLFVIVLTIAIIIVGIWIATHGQTKVYDTYAVDMREAVSGLSIHGPVKFNGVDVGYIKAISLNRHDPRIVHVLLNIQQGTPINESTTATLDSQFVSGISYIEVKTPNSAAPALKLNPGQRYPFIQWTPSVLFQLDTALREVSANIKSATISFNKLLNDQNLAALHESLMHIAKFTNTLSANSAELNRIIKNTSAASEKLPAVIQQLHTTLISVNNATKKIGAAGKNASATFRNGQIAVQNISEQTLPATMETLNRLNSVLSNLQQVTQQLQHNPSILVRGVQPQTLGPGER